jgi:hypothetical protein
LPASLLVPPFKMLDEHRYEHDGQCSGCEQIIEKIGKGKASEVEVCLPAGAQRTADDLLANETHNAAKKNRSGPYGRSNSNCTSLALHLLMLHRSELNLI